MKRNIIVEVSDLADEKEITLAIAKALNQKKLGSPERLQLGSGKDNVKIILPEYDIKVVRKIPDAPEPIKCHCGTEFIPGAGVKYKNNYGGVTKTHEVCSDECFDTLKEICGDRVAKMRQKLKPIVKAPDYIAPTEHKEEEPSPTTIRMRKENGALIFTMGGKPYEPTIKDLKAIKCILKLAK